WLVYHRIALPASTYSRGKGVCLFPFIVPELDPATYAWRHLLTKLGASSPLGSGPELRQSQGRRISRDVVVRWDTRGKKPNDKARRCAVRSQKMTPHRKLGSNPSLRVHVTQAPQMAVRFCGCKTAAPVRQHSNCISARGTGVTRPPCVAIQFLPRHCRTTRWDVRRGPMLHSAELIFAIVIVNVPMARCGSSFHLRRPFARWPVSRVQLLC